MQAQLDDLSRRVSVLEDALEIRRSAPAAPTPAPEARPQIPAPPWPARPGQVPVRPPREPRPPREIDLSALLGAKTLAIVGGAVTLLGIVFFVRAHSGGDHEWIGPVGRVALGAAASTLLFAAGLVLRRRFGATHAALVAVGAGIAGAYATLLAATALYHLIPAPAALAAAVGIAAVGTVTALAWRSQLVAGFGLVGAILAPAALAFQDGVSPLGIVFAALVFGATAAVALRRGWGILLKVAVAVSAPQVAILVLLPENHGAADPGAVAAAAIFALVYLATAIANDLVRPGRLAGMTASLAFGAGILAVGSSYRLFATPVAQGLALLAVTLVYAAAAVVLRRRRDLASLLGAAAFTAGALSLAALLTGNPLTYAWAAESAAIAWLARRTKELRFRLWSTVYAGLALGHVMILDAPIRQLLDEDATSAAGAPAVLAVAAALAVYAWQTCSWPKPQADDFLGELDEAFASVEPVFAGAARWLAGVLTAYSASLAIVGLASSFDWAHAAVAAVWCVSGLAIVAVAVRRGSESARLGGDVWLWTTAVFVFFHGLVLDPHPRGVSYTVLAISLLAAALVEELRPERVSRIDPIAAAGVVAAQVVAFGAAASLLTTRHEGGAALLGIAAIDASLAAVLFRRPRERDFVTFLWGAGAVLAAGAAALLTHDTTLLTVAWAAGAAAFAALVRLTRERRFLYGALGFEALALLLLVSVDAPLSHLFGEDDPHTGTLAVLAVAAAGAAIAAAASGRIRRWAASAAGVLVVYALSIAILSVTAFHTGHTLVSAFWGLVGLALLLGGLRRFGALRLAGFAVFAVAVGKLFLFDLSSLSSITRALSFLAVGAVLLVGGFFYQRLTVTLRSAND
jgi:uncharacterized membrane protein